MSLLQSLQNRLFGIQGVPVAGANVLITGGASGIGLAMAKLVASRGARNVVIWDLNGEAAQKAADSLSAPGHAYQVDVTDSDAVAQAAEDTLNTLGRVDILINNAGIVTGQYFLDQTDEDVERTFNVNVLALYRVTRQFLPGMLERGKGAVVTIASAAGLVGVSRQTDYSASKFAAVGFNDSLRAELRHNYGDQGGDGIHTMVYCPFYIDTGMFDGVKSKVPWLLPILKTDEAAKSIIDSLEAGVQFKTDPLVPRLAIAAKALPTPLYDRMLDLLGVNSTMDEFQGHDKNKKNEKAPIESR